MSCLGMGLLVFNSANLHAAQYETSTVISASQILPADLIRGPNHQVDEQVVNDGFLNIYTINTRYGAVKAVSTAKLHKYVKEINAAVLMDQVERSDEFVGGVKATAGRVVEGAGNLITDPVGSVSGAVSGIGALFRRAGETDRSDVEDSRLKAAFGYSSAKREYAYEFGVDVYSRNEILQKKLNSLSSAGFAGSISASAALMFVPGAAGAAVSVAGGTKLMNQVFRNTPPSELRIMNRKKLEAMRVSPDIIDLFISNSVFTPREQTIIVLSLERMGKINNPDAFVKLSVLTDDPDIAFFRHNQAVMYANYDQKVEPIERFVQLGQAAAAKTRSGKLVFNVPLDYLLWTRGLAALGSVVTQNVALMKGVKERHLYVTGDLSPLAKSSMEKMGWVIHNNAMDLL